MASTRVDCKDGAHINLRVDWLTRSPSSGHGGTVPNLKRLENMSLYYFPYGRSKRIETLRSPRSLCCVICGATLVRSWLSSPRAARRRIPPVAPQLRTFYRYRLHTTDDRGPKTGRPWPSHDSSSLTSDQGRPLLNGGRLVKGDKEGGNSLNYYCQKPLPKELRGQVGVVATAIALLPKSRSTNPRPSKVGAA